MVAPLYNTSIYYEKLPINVIKKATFKQKVAHGRCFLPGPNLDCKRVSNHEEKDSSIPLSSYSKAEYDKRLHENNTSVKNDPQKKIYINMIIKEIYFMM